MKLSIIILIPVSQASDTIRSKSQGGDSYANGWERIFGKKDAGSSDPPRPSSLN